MLRAKESTYWYVRTDPSWRHTEQRNGLQTEESVHLPSRQSGRMADVEEQKSARLLLGERRWGKDRSLRQHQK
jgi:hypothetical protein